MTIQELTTCPAGHYLVRVDDVQESTTPLGDVRWSLRLIVVRGRQIGRLAAWTHFDWGAPGRARAREIFRSLGLHTPPRPSEEARKSMLGKHVFVDVAPIDGEKRNRVVGDWRLLRK